MTLRLRADVAEDEKCPSDLLYTLEDNPPWYLCVFLAAQHFFTMVSTTIPIPFVLASLLCLEPSDPARSHLVSTVIFVSGLITLLQSTVGVRLPIVQGGNFAYLIPTVAVLSANFVSCEAQWAATVTAGERQEAWQARMRVIQGNIAVSSLFQILLGFTGLIGVVLKWITPLTIVTTVSLVGLSLFDLAASCSSLHWGVSLSTTVLMILLSQYMKDLSLSLPTGYRSGHGLTYSKVQIFKMFSILLTLLVAWLVCWLLTITEVFPKGSPARTDLTSTLLHDTPWFRIPYPGQWGWPTATVAGVLGMMSAGLASIIESVGDYYATARICGARAPPAHAINRGVAVEGLGVAVAGLFGTGSGTNSYSENLAVITVTRVGSRRVVQVSALVMLVAGSVCKFGAVFASIPEPVVASIFWVMFSLITAIGLSTLQFVDMNSSRNLFVVGFSLFFSLSISKYVKANPESIMTGLPLLDQLLQVMLQTTIFLGCLLGCFLDNTIPGTAEERGLVAWRRHLYTGPGGSSSYHLPFVIFTRIKWLRYLPFSSTFTGFKQTKCETVEDTTPTPGAALTPTPGAALTPTPGAALTPTPGAALTPTPGAALTPTPGAALTPTPGAALTPTPGAALPPTPGAALTPTPGAALTPTPGAALTPTPGAALTPTPGAALTPTPGAALTPTPGAALTPTPGAALTPTPGAVASTKLAHAAVSNRIPVHETVFITMHNAVRTATPTPEAAHIPVSNGADSLLHEPKTAPEISLLRRA